jgi:hypothetical protein
MTSPPRTRIVSPTPICSIGTSAIALSHLRWALLGARDQAGGEPGKRNNDQAAPEIPLYLHLQHPKAAGALRLAAHQPCRLSRVDRQKNYRSEPESIHTSVRSPNSRWWAVAAEDALQPLVIDGLDAPSTSEGIRRL